MIFVMSGPSGSGKTTLRDQLLKDRVLKKYLVKSVSFTTRKARSREKDKQDYFFVSEAEFKSLLRAKKILEWTKYLGYYYATSKDFLDKQLKNGKSVILCLDLKGALSIKRLYARDCATIFILPPSMTALQKRIEGRCSKTKKEEVRRRLELAKRELAEAKKYEFCVVNNNLTQAVGDLKTILLNKISDKLK